jgi:hypothetical protein
LDKAVDLVFEPFGEKNDIHSRGLGLIKTNFRQFIGLLNGQVTCNGEVVKVTNKIGLFEIHKSL